MPSVVEALARTRAHFTQDLSWARAALAPTGVLRVAINRSNFVLVTGSAAGEPVGVSPALARALADVLGVTVKLVVYASPGDVADAAAKDEWDVANIAADEARVGIDFSAAYAEIESCFLVKEGCVIRLVEEVDREGIVVVCKERAAYTLWLQRNYVNVEFRLVENPEHGLHVFCEGGENVVLAGLRSRLVEDAEEASGRVLEGKFCVASQAMAVRKGGEVGFVDSFVRVAKDCGLVEALIREHNVEGKIAVAR